MSRPTDMYSFFVVGFQGFGTGWFNDVRFSDLLLRDVSVDGWRIGLIRRALQGFVSASGCRVHCLGYGLQRLRLRSGDEGATVSLHLTLQTPVVGTHEFHDSLYFVVEILP